MAPIETVAKVSASRHLFLSSKYRQQAAGAARSEYFTKSAATRKAIDQRHIRPSSAKTYKPISARARPSRSTRKSGIQKNTRREVMKRQADATARGIEEAYL